MADMKYSKENIGITIVGLGFSILGLLQLFTLLNWVSISVIVSIYNTVLPVLIVLAGLYVLIDDNPSQHKKVGFALIVVGSIVLLARFGVLGWDVINGVIGAILLITGTALTTFAVGQMRNPIVEKDIKKPNNPTE